MKKIYKIMVFVLMMVLAIGSVALAPITVFAAGAALVGATIVLTTMPKSGKLNSEIKIPKGTANAGADNTELTVKVVDPRGGDVVLTDNGTDYSFTPKMVGNYKVTYTAAANGAYASTSETFVISVTSTKAVLTMPTNSPFILQDKVGANSTVVLPYPTVYVDGEEVENADVKVRVTDPKHNTWEANGTLTGYTNPLATKVVDGKTYYTFKAATKDSNAIYGTYSIQYSYKNTATNEVTTKSYSIAVSANYSVENQKVTFTWKGSLPESAVLGNELELPTPVTVDSNNGGASVATYTKVKVEYFDANNQLVDGNIEVKDFKFTPKYQAKSGSYYKLTYKIYTLENLDLANANYTTLEAALAAGEANAVVRTYSLTNVTDTVAPVPQIVANYEIAANGNVLDATAENLKNQDVSYLIPTKAKTEVEIDIPAIYATDNYNEFKDITLERTLLDENNNTYDLNGSTTTDDADSPVTIVRAALNATAKITFHKAGKYTIRYRATDAANNRKDISCEIVVSTDLNDTVAPTIKLPTIPATAKPGDKVEFAEATIVDYETTEANSVTVDANVKKDVYYFYSNAKVFTDAELEEMVGANGFNLLNKNAEGKAYSFDVDENATKSYAVVAFRAEDDAKYSQKGANNVAWKYKAIRLFNVDDSVAPILETDLATIANSFLTEGENTYGQGQTVTIDDLQFRDKDNNTVDADPTTYTTNYLTASLKVYDKNGKEIKVNGVQYVYDGTYFTVKGGKFITTVAADKADEYYTIVISATDLGGNTLVNSVKFQVNDTKAPIIETENVDSTMELGKTYVLPTPVVLDDGEEIDNHAATVVEFGEANPSYEFNHATNEFTPHEVGTYTFRFIAEDDATPANRTYTGWYTVTVEDTIKPVIYIDENNGYTVPETAAYKDADNNVVPVELPLFSATDEYNGVETIEVSVKDPNGDELTATVVDGTHYEFTPNRNGVYTVTYKAVDKAGNAATQTYTVKVGDVTAPTITVETANVPGTYKIGDTVSVDLTKISTADDVDGTKKGSNIYNDGLKVKLVGPDGEEISWTKEENILTYEFTKAGTYTLTYTATDEAGNSDDVVYTFEVKSTANSSAVTETVWGVVLVVASIALLAGVVIYFVKTKDKPDTKEKKKD